MMLAYLSWLTLRYIDAALAPRAFATLLLVILMINIVLNVIANLHQMLAKPALTDPSTGCFNRHHLEQTDSDGAMVIAEDILHRIEVAELLPDRPVTVSIGVSQYQAGP